MIDKAIAALRPGASFILVGTTYEGLQWLDTEQSRPSREEVAAEVERQWQLYRDTEYQRQRALEYPDFREYLDAVVKGDQAQMQAYIDACNAIKAKYPKPTGV